ncbi:CdaR family transcriptional regulator [Amycolatopsis sp. KNN50.9b]|uniref:PucR family transcriptional regulator n=1 Tax=Amycolatopsis sp. KNN50.9b TaxID=2018303 RepID=UPI001E634158|nr:helix-turn-helix domain-containing protein [Amycolatopsis sp. KNN50.9b]
MASERDPRGWDVPALAARAARDAGGVPAEFLDGYLEMLDLVSRTGRRLTRDELESRRMLGARAAERNIPLRALADLYLSANWMAWRNLPAVAAAADKDHLRSIAEAIMRAADDAVVALADGYDNAQRRLTRRQEAERREFIDDLLYGHGDLGKLAERAERFGLRLAGSYVVAAARADHPFTDGDSTAHRVESALLTRFDARDLLVTVKDGLLLCLAPGAAHPAVAEFARHLGILLAGRAWQIGVGRPHPGPGGVLRSFQEARNALELAESLGLTAPVLNAADLLVFQVLYRDRAAIVDLVDTVLSPLTRTRGGARPLLDTLAAYFATGGVTAETARNLFLSVRAVTYRLDRIRNLTGLDPRQPAQRFTLEAAVLGARLLGWPGPD